MWQQRAFGWLMDAAWRGWWAEWRSRPPHPCAEALCNSICGGQFTVQRMADGRRAVGGGSYAKHPNRAVVLWHITRRCTFHCDYCCARPWMEAWRGRREMGEEQVAEACCWLRSVFAGGSLTLVGGEPTLHPAFGRCVREMVGGGGWEVCAMTNFSRPSVILEATASLPQADRRRFSLCWALHAHQAACDQRAMFAAARRWRMLNPDGSCSVMIIDYLPNFRRLPDDYERLFAELNIHWGVHPDLFRLAPVRYPQTVIV